MLAIGAVSFLQYCMMLPPQFTLGRDLKYPAGVVPGALERSYQEKARIHDELLAASIYVRRGANFKASFKDFIGEYLRPFLDIEFSYEKLSDFVAFWPCQVNFAMWCAATGCGVSVQDHMRASDDMLSSLFRFHVYFQARRILRQLAAPLPGEKGWDMNSNPYDKPAYEQLCLEFGVSKYTDWRLDWGSSIGLKFEGSPPTKIAVNAFVYFMLDRSQGFTAAGEARLNESIRTYVWAILGAQDQTRTSILGTGQAFDAQKHFIVLVERAIDGADDIPNQIAKYQSVLQYAHSKLDFVIGEGLYMIPSDMELRLGAVEGYNNEIQIATVGMTLGTNNAVNVASPSASIPPPAPLKHSSDQPLASGSAKSEDITHEDVKNLLGIGFIALGVAAITFARVLR